MLFGNNEDPDEMPQNSAFYQGLHCEVQYYLEIITCDPSIYTTDHPYLTVSNLMFFALDYKVPIGSTVAQW